MRTRSRTATLVLCATFTTACGEGPTVPKPDPQYPAVRVVTFGDSNTDHGYDNSPQPVVVARSYVSNRLAGRLAPGAPDHRAQLAGLVEAGWTALGRSSIAAVNHGIGGTTTGGGSGGGPDRHGTTAPNARTVVGGVTRFDAEVLGMGYPWSGGESSLVEYPAGPIQRVNAFAPGSHDFAYISMGTNDASSGLTTEQTLANLEWMIDRWTGSGRRADHLLITTLPPRGGSAGATIPAINAGIRELALRRGVQLIDLSAYTSDDDGATWKSAGLHVGDELHYATVVREWIAAQIVAHLRDVVKPVAQ